MYKQNEIIHNQKYANNYDYQKAIKLMNTEKFEDFNFFLMEENKSLFSAIGTINYSYYNTLDDAKKIINKNHNDIQTIVCSEKVSQNFENTTGFGLSQKPKINDYADNIDTLEAITR